MRALGYTLLFITLLPASAYASSLININTADVALLDTLPGIGPVRAAAIVEYRKTHGPFTTIEGLLEVKGIGPVTFEGIKTLVTVGASSVPVPKNTKTDSAPQPSLPVAGSTVVQKVESVTSKVSPPAYEAKAVVAPTATTTVAAVGAALPASHSFTELMTSPWTLGFIGVLIFSGVALILL